MSELPPKHLELPEKTFDEAEDLSFVVLGKSLELSDSEETTAMVRQSMSFVEDLLKDSENLGSVETTVPQPPLKPSFETELAEAVASLSGSEPSSDFISSKVLELIEENRRLKEALSQNDQSLSVQYDKILSWKSIVEESYDDLKLKFLGAKQEIDRLNEEKLELTEKLTTEQRDNEDLKKQAEENKSQDQMKLFDLESSTIKLRDLQNSNEFLKNSSDLITKERDQLKDDNKILMDQNDKLLTYNKTLTNQIAELTAKGELNLLKEQLLGAQTALTEMETEKHFFKSQFELLKEQITEINNEKYALQTQLEWFKNDYQEEHTLKLDFEGKNEKLTEDLLQLQQRNDQLQREIQSLGGRIPEDLTTSGVSSSGATASPSVAEYTCPVCVTRFRSFRILQDHLELCIHN